MLVGLPLCAVGGVLYSWTSGKGVVAGMISAYGALFKVPGDFPSLPTLCAEHAPLENRNQRLANERGRWECMQACRFSGHMLHVR